MPNTSKKKTISEGKFDFEKAMAKLNQIQAKLESGNLPLEKAIEQFEQGSALINECREVLKRAEQRVKILTQNNAEPEPFEPKDE